MDNSDLSFTDKIAQYAHYRGTNSDTDTTGDYSLYDLSSVIFEVYDIKVKKIVEDYRGIKIAGLQ